MNDSTLEPRKSEGESAQSAEDRLEQSRQRVQARLSQVGQAVDREVERVRDLKTAAVALLGFFGVLVATQRLAKSSRRKKKLKKSPRRSSRKEKN